MESTQQRKGKSYFKIRVTAKSLFWKYGISRVTVEEICKEAGVSKMTFYRNFGNKMDVAEAVLVQLVEKGYSDYRKIMDSDIPFTNKIHRIVQIKHDNSENLSSEFLQDIYGTSATGLKKILEGAQQRTLQALREDLCKAQQQGEIRKDLKIDFILYMINSLNEKLLDHQLTSMFKNTQELAVELTNFIFYGIMPNGTK